MLADILGQEAQNEIAILLQQLIPCATGENVR